VQHEEFGVLFNDQDISGLVLPKHMCTRCAGTPKSSTKIAIAKRVCDCRSEQRGYSNKMQSQDLISAKRKKREADNLSKAAWKSAESIFFSQRVRLP
jgi:hypothetical protein